MDKETGCCCMTGSNTSRDSSGYWIDGSPCKRVERLSRRRTQIGERKMNRGDNRVVLGFNAMTASAYSLLVRVSQAPPILPR